MPVFRRRTHLSVLPLLAVLLLALGGCSHLGGGSWPTAEAGEAVRKAVAAYGGEEAIRRVSSFREEGTVTSIMQGRGNIVREFRYPDRLRVSIAYGPKIEVRILDGRRGWRQGKEVTGAPLDAMILQAARHALPLLLLDRKKELVDKGTDTFEDREVRVLELPVGEKLVVTAEIDTATGRIVRSAGRGENGGAMGGSLEFLTTYTEFATGSGVLFPVREINYANGFVTGETVIGKIEVVDVPESAFRP
jgi:hypothetical protein